ncbi:MAG TPA: serine hydroxymethyltransferase, partial [Gemmatimonadales bacterium]|nr:serine hydroxymethyltransferase [Gemmatimonadales bacterium]
VRNAAALGHALLERGYKLVSGGTDTHLLLVDLRPKKLTGKAAENVLGQVGITVNKNAIPNDPESPFVTSGIRLGTPALTTRGMGEGEMRTIGTLIDTALMADGREGVLKEVAAEVKELAAAFPLYAGSASTPPTGPAPLAGGR